VSEASIPRSATDVAKELAGALEAAGCEYALGGAIALGFWAEPRGTIDVDVTIYLPPQETTAAVRCLQKLGCQFNTQAARRLLEQHGFCHVEFAGGKVDVFLPTSDFHERARGRKVTAYLGDQEVVVWDAESLCVFKMMFFRRKDLADVEQILRVQGERLDREWIAAQLEELFGARDPRVSEFAALCAEVDSALGGAGA
jgi:hypothetical protein